MTSSPQGGWLGRRVRARIGQACVRGRVTAVEEVRGRLRLTLEERGAKSHIEYFAWAEDCAVCQEAGGEAG